MNLKQVERIIDEIRDERAMKLFGKHEWQLEPIEMDRLNDEINPQWKIIKSGNGVEVEVNNIGQVRDPITRELYKIYGYEKNGKSLYPIIKVKNKSNEGSMEYVHRLVAQAFCPNDNPSIKTEINHIDGDKTNNWAGNLEWCDRSYNIKQAYRTNLRPEQPKGEASPVAKYSDDTVRIICEYLSKPAYQKWSSSEIADAVGVPRSLVDCIYERKRRTNVSKDYTFLPRDYKALFGHQGESNVSTKYKDEDVEKLCNDLDELWNSEGKLSKDMKLSLADKYGFPATFVKALWQGETRTYISENHQFYKDKYGSK